MIALPASNADVLAGAIEPALELLPERMRTPRAQVMLLAIGRQESGFAARAQIPSRIARGFWQFEQPAVVLTLNHAYVGKYLPGVCAACGIPFGSKSIYEALEHDDVLAAAVARLYLYADPKPLPEIGDTDGAWKCYARTWRPGKPHPITWPGHYAKAVATLRG